MCNYFYLMRIPVVSFNIQYSFDVQRATSEALWATLHLIYFLVRSPISYPYTPGVDFHVFPFGCFHVFPPVSMCFHIRLRGNTCTMQQWKYMETCETYGNARKFISISFHVQGNLRKNEETTCPYVEIREKCNTGNSGKFKEIDFQYFPRFPRMWSR